jgi:transposase
MEHVAFLRTLRYFTGSLARGISGTWGAAPSTASDNAILFRSSRVLDQRLQFLSSYQKKEMSVADPCRQYGISRPTGYCWINRYEETGPEGLVDRSRRPHTCSHATLEPMENAILVLRARHPSWGARKLRRGWRRCSRMWCGQRPVPLEIS